MAKLFKAISLVERLKLSSYGELPAQPLTKINQGSVDQIQTSLTNRSSTNLKTIEIKSTSSLVGDKTTTKNTTRNPTVIIGQTPERKNILPATSSNLVLPIIKLGFASTIQLADRLEQSPNSQTTNHLPHYFLSDLFTGYLTIKPFGVYDHTLAFSLPNGFYKAPEFISKSNKVGITPAPYVFDSLLRQGTIFSNGSYVSITNPTRTRTTVTISQGVSIINGVAVSSTQITLGSSLREIEINQGLRSIATGLTSVVKLDTPKSKVPQGGINITQAVSPLITRLLQGIKKTNTGIDESFVKTQQVPSTLKLQSKPSTIQKPDFSILVFNQGTVILQNVDFKTQKFKQGTGAIQVTAFEASRALSILLPRIKHGSATIPIKDFTSIKFDGQLIEVAQGVGVLLEALEQSEGGGIPQSSLLHKQNIGIHRLLTEQLSDEAASELIRSTIVGKSNTSQGNVRKFKPKDPTTTFKLSQQTQFITNIKTSPKNKSLNVKPDGVGSDFVNLKINGIQFKALITSFSDSWSPSWTDQTYVGRQDVLKVFKGVTRSVSLGFKVVAWSSVADMYTRLEKLIKTTVVGSPEESYIVAPLTKITVGSLFKNTVCACTSLKYDFNPSEYSWDIDVQRPMIVDVSMDFAILKSNNNQMFNAKTNTYFG